MTPETTGGAPTPGAEACTVVIFGATGDLTQRKLMPALYSLQCFGALSSRCEVIGTGRTPLSVEEFRVRMREAACPSPRGGGVDDPRWRGFEQRLAYLVGDPNDPASARPVAATLAGQSVAVLSITSSLTEFALRRES